LTDPVENDASAPVEEQEQDRPWEAPGAVRRDGEPHRGPFLRVLSQFARYIAFFSVPACSVIVLALAALALGATVYLLARRDLLLMEQHLMDPEGGVETAEAKANAREAIVLSLFSFFCFGTLLALNRGLLR
jgi:hypothetical protein